MKRAVIAFVATLGSACAPMYQLSASKTVPSKPETCDYQVLATMPAGGYEEIGVIVNNYPASGGAIHVENFRKMVGDQVCKAGGDMVVTQINGEGFIMRGVVLRKL